MKMKKLTRFACLFGAIILFWGCPYSSQVALGPAIEKLRPELIGSWIPEGETGLEHPSYYTISKYDSVRYAVTHHQFQDDSKEYSTKDYVGHTSYFDGFLFMNLVESGTEEYLIHRIDLTPNGFKLFEVTDNIDERFDSSADMQAFFKKNMRASFFYNKDEVSLIRK
jgi:hypothetical protein